MNRRLKRCAVALLIVSGIAVAGFLLFAERCLRIQNRNPDRAADAVVVLAGTADEDRDRVEAGIQLMRRSRGRFIILPFRHQSFSWAWVVARYDSADAVDAERVIVGHASGTDLDILSRYGGTYLEAFKTAHIMQRRRLQSAVIVSSAYHMRRVRLAFEQFRKSHRLTFFYHSVEHGRRRPFLWWWDHTYFFKVLTEYKKLIVAHLLYEPA